MTQLCSLLLLLLLSATLARAQITAEVLKEVLIPKEEFETSSNYDATLNCHCVPYYQCDDNGHISTSGSVASMVIEPKIGSPVYNVKVCPMSNEGNILRCCTLPEGFTVPPKHQGGNIETTTAEVPNRVGTTGTKSVCGRILLDGRISDGEGTQFGEFPWMVIVLEIQASVINLFNCGGSLIHPQVVLTAAHCVQNKVASQLKIRAGDHITNTVSTLDEPLPHQDRHVKEIRRINTFNSSNLFNDVALLVLETPLEPANNVGTICLPEPSSGTGVTGGRQFCVATGWGRRGSTDSEDSDFQARLKKVKLEIIPSSSCQEKLRDTRLGQYFLLDKSFLCAQGERKKDTCQGDGGGPLVCPAADGSFVQTGITAWGIGCGGEVPGVYADVAHARHWIDEQMQQLGFDVNGNFDRHLPVGHGIQAKIN